MTMLGSELQLLTEEVAMLEARATELIRTIGKWQERCETLRELLQQSQRYVPTDMQWRITDAITDHHTGRQV
jgi:prefoldin subunit 5